MPPQTFGQPLAYANADAETPYPGESFALAGDRANFSRAILAVGIKAHVHFRVKFSCCTRELIPFCTLGRYINNLPACEYACGLEPGETVSPYLMPAGILCPSCRTKPLDAFMEIYYGSSTQRHWGSSSCAYGTDAYTRTARTTKKANCKADAHFKLLAGYLEPTQAEDEVATARYEAHKLVVDRICRERIEADYVSPSDIITPWEEKYKHKDAR